MNIFYDLDLFGKETVVSKMFAWLFDPKGTHCLEDRFLDELFSKIGINKNYNIDTVKITREFLGKYEGRNNFIDIVIECETYENKKIAIGIENKVYSNEGYKQTERYKKIMNKEFDKEIYDVYCVYLTYENLPVSLSNKQFMHLKYEDFQNVYEQSRDNIIVNDFYNAYMIDNYIKSEELTEMRFNDFTTKFPDRSLDTELCKWLAVNISKNHRDRYVAFDRSSKGGYGFFQYLSNDWYFKIDDEEMNIHLEGGLNNVKIHFETVPYKPQSKLSQELIETMGKYRTELRKLFDFELEINGIEKLKVSRAEILTIGKYRLHASKFNEFYDHLNVLFDEVDSIMKKVDIPAIRV